MVIYTHGIYNKQLNFGQLQESINLLFYYYFYRTSKAQKVSVTLDRLKELMPVNCFWLEWRCQSHTDLISSIQLIEKPRSLLITSDDGRVSICNENGTRLGVLLTEHDPEAKWSFNIDVNEIYHVEEERLEHVKSDLVRYIF